MDRQQLIVAWFLAGLIILYMSHRAIQAHLIETLAKHRDHLVQVVSDQLFWCGSERDCGVRNV